MSEYRIQSETLEGIADAIRNKTGGSELINPEDMADEIDGISGITTGLVYKNVDTDTGYPEEIEFYGETVPDYFAGYTSTAIYTANVYVERVILTNSTKTIRRGAFAYNTHIKYLSVPDTVTSINNTANPGFCVGSSLEDIEYNSSVNIDWNFFTKCNYLVSFSAPNVTKVLNSTNASTNAAFYNNTSLETVTLGSIGVAVTTVHNTSFLNCTQSGLTITLYTIGSYVDTLVTNIRNGATNATIIIKASEETEYNGTTYSAGDTILTSEVESNES